MDFQEGSPVIKLLKYQDGLYQVVSGKKGMSFKLPLKLAARELQKLGVSMEEFEYAVIELERNSHNVADFGVWRKSFIYSTFERLAEPLFGNS